MSEFRGFKRVKPVVPRRRPRFYEQMYPVPNWCATDEDDLRWGHLDLDEMSLQRLCLERDRLRDRLRHDPAPPSWLFGRLHAIEERISNDQG